VAGDGVTRLQEARAAVEIGEAAARLFDQDLEGRDVPGPHPRLEPGFGAAGEELDAAGHVSVAAGGGGARDQGPHAVGARPRVQRLELAHGEGRLRPLRDLGDGETLAVAPGPEPAA